MRILSAFLRVFSLIFDPIKKRRPCGRQKIKVKNSKITEKYCGYFKEISAARYFKGIAAAAFISSEEKLPAIY